MRSCRLSRKLLAAGVGLGRAARLGRMLSHGWAAGQTDSCLTRGLWQWGRDPGLGQEASSAGLLQGKAGSCPLPAAQAQDRWVPRVPGCGWMDRWQRPGLLCPPQDTTACFWVQKRGGLMPPRFAKLSNKRLCLTWGGGGHREPPSSLCAMGLVLSACRVLLSRMSAGAVLAVPSLTHHQLQLTPGGGTSALSPGKRHSQQSVPSCLPTWQRPMPQAGRCSTAGRSQEPVMVVQGWGLHCSVGTIWALGRAQCCITASTHLGM